MVVYVEYVVIDNFVLDYLLIYLARKSLKLPVKFVFLFASAALGAAEATLFPLFGLSDGFAFLYRFFSAVALVAVSGKFSKFKEFVYCFYLFLFFTFLFGGIVFAVFFAVGKSVDPLTMSDYTAEIPLGLILATAFLSAFLSIKGINRFYAAKTKAAFTRRCIVSVGGKVFDAKGYVDSGNRLSYGRTGSPIAVCGRDFREKLITSGALDGVSFDEISFNTVSGKSYMKVFKAERFLIYNGDDANIINSVMLGFTNNESKTDYDLLLAAIMA